MTYRSAIALGSNLGDRLTTLQTAVGRLGELGIVTAVSSLYETAPMGGPEQGPFLNAVVVVDSDLEPEALLAALHLIEDGAGRVRQERWGPRTLDLDIVTMLDGSGSPVTVATPDLTVPHPRAAERRFVLAPLAEVWPQAPLGTTSAAHALESVVDQAVEMVAGEWTTSSASVANWLVAAQLLGLAVFAVATVVTGGWPPSITRAAVGGTLALMGVATMTAAAMMLGPGLTPSPEPPPEAELVSSGPYGWVRHPIYLGLLATLAGAAIMAGSVAGVLTGLAMAVLLWFKAGYEERRLRLRVPGYSAYMRAVAGRLLPRPGNVSDEP